MQPPSRPLRPVSGDVLVDTPAGRVRGRQGEGSQSFWGIPYGAPTGGANRFRPPQPVAPWAGVHDALLPGPSAPQGGTVRDLSRWYGQTNGLSEDCLHLNVFTPQAGRSVRRPVMVWLHGGNWSSYSATPPTFDASRLARDGDVVVVTLNHRLNLFGYLQLEQADERFADSGNAGVLDMVAALHWVRDSIEAFGGDPGCVTLFGQSGGGGKVSALLATPAAHGLFHRAVAQSCSGSLYLTRPAEAAELSQALARQLGLARPTPEALQRVTMEQLVAAHAAAPRPYRPVLDGRTFTRHPFDADAPPLSAHIPFMVGNTASETRMALSATRANFALELPDVRRRIARFLQADATQTDRILEAYRDAEPQGTPSDLLAAVTSDYLYVRNTLRQAQLQAAAGRAPVFVYRFDWRTPVWDGLLRSPHTLELPFLFGTPQTAAELVGPPCPAHEALCRTLIGAWSAFARTGDPNHAGMPQWPRYQDGERATLLIDAVSRVAFDPGAGPRATLEGLPWYEYAMPMNYVQP